MGSKKQTILTLNGKRYDALTGQQVDDTVSQPAVRQVMDVVALGVSNPTQVAAPTPAPTAIPHPPVNPNGPKVMDVSRSTVHLKPRQPQRANTLVRSAVNKPKPGLKSQTKVSAPTKALSVPQNSVTPKLSVSQISQRRQKRAVQTPKSQAISKFSTVDETTAARREAAVRVDKPVVVPSTESQVPQNSNDLFEKAIANADSHTQTLVDPKKLSKQARKQAKQAAKATKRPVHHHLASVVAASLAVLVIGGLVGLQNKDALTLRFANAQAGFKASLPTYQPEGYGVGSFTYSAGNVGTTFHDADNGRNYSLNQQTTKWDSQDLLDTYVAVNYPSYQTLQSGDQIIYIYGKNDASWVKNGIWYQLISNGSLSTSQVLNIAASV